MAENLLSQALPPKKKYLPIMGLYQRRKPNDFRDVRIIPFGNYLAGTEKLRN
jgi:hypothetical protein